MTDSAKDKTTTTKEKSSSKRSTKALRVVHLRNRFLYITYRYVLMLLVFSAFMFVFSLSMMIYFIKQPIPPQYVPVSVDGRLLDLPTIDQEIKTEAEVIDFFLRGLKKTHIFDYYNYRDQLSEASSYFTITEWNKFFTKLSEAKTLDAIKENRWISSISFTGPPLIKERGLVNGVFTWYIEAPVKISYIGSKGRVIGGAYSGTVVRISKIDNPEGIAISRITFIPEKSSGNIDKTEK